MNGSDSDGSYKVGKGRPPKERQFKPGKSPNPRGRPPKRKSILAPAEMRRVLLMILDEEVEITTPSGVRKATTFEAVLRRLIVGAAKGNPTQLRHALTLIPQALQGRVDAHRAVWLADLLQDVEQTADGRSDPLLRETLKTQLKHIDKLY